MDRNSDSRNQQKDLPGYPHYPSNEDITNPENGLRKVAGDVENLANSNAISRRISGNSDLQQDALEDRNDMDDDIRIVPGTEADVTEDDLIILGDRDADQDMGDDENIQGKARVDNVDLQNDALDEDELDIPEESDEREDAAGEGDEENSYYSLGGDSKDSLEEDQA